MSGREWKPGDVAMVSNLAGDKPRLAYRGETSGSAEPCWWFMDTRTWTYGANIRPLAVIDFEDREQVELLVRWYYERFAQIPGASVSIEGGEIDAMQAALRDFANPTPPKKPDEPTGLGAVVEDANGYVWLGNRFDPAIPWAKPWFCSDLNSWADWCDINVAEVHSKGWSR